MVVGNETVGIFRASAWRTVYPYPPPGGYNPAISVNHFFAPRRIAAALGLA